MKKKHMKKRILLCVLCGATVLLGFGKKPVTLIDDLPLIDLGKAIQEAKFGQNGNPENANGDNSDAQGRDGQENLQSPQPADNVRTHYIKVRGETIKYNDKEYVMDEDNETACIRRMDADLRVNYKKGDKIVVRDDYEEAHFFKNVAAQIEKLKESFKIEDRDITID